MVGQPDAPSLPSSPAISAGSTWSISHKFIVLVATAVAIFMIAAFFLTRAMLEDYALAAADDTAAIILDQTDKRLAAFFADMEALARSLAGTRFVSGVDVAGMRDLFISAVRARQTYLRSVYLGTADGRMFEWGIGPEFVDFTPSFPDGYDPRVRPWYRSALERGEFGVSEPYKYASVDAVGITCVLPVAGPDGAIIGVLGMDILLERLGSVLEGLRIPRQGKAFILSADGHIIAGQRQSDRPAGGVLPQFEPMPVGGAGLATVMFDGRETQLLHKRIEGLDWTVVVALPLEPIRESMRTLIDLISLVEIGLMLALIAALGTISGRLIVAPLGQLVSVINRIEAGERGLRVRVTTHDEFGVLGTEFNRLVDTVEDYSASLEEKVRIRTEELVRLQRENTRLRVIEERRRIYRDMHDTIGAKLTNIFFCANVARDLVISGGQSGGHPAAPETASGNGAHGPADGHPITPEAASGSGAHGLPEVAGSPARLMEMIDTIDTNCTQAVDSLRGIILGMSRDDERASSFALSVSVGVRRRLQAASVECDCIIQSRRALEQLPPRTREELERIIDELVSNVLRHASATKVRLRLAMGRGGLRLSFRDDGKGMDPALVRKGLGLDNIQYRAGTLGGSARLISAPGKGCAWNIHIPVTPARGSAFSSADGPDSGDTEGGKVGEPASGSSEAATRIDDSAGAGGQKVRP